MFLGGNFYALERNDFDHGHFVWRPGTRRAYDSLDDILKDVAFVVYHTDEHAGRWESPSQRRLLPKKRTQRSIVGYPNGGIQSAIELVGESQRNELPYYKLYGTVRGEDLASSIRPELARYDPVTVMVREKRRLLFNQFAICPHPQGRFLVGGIHYEIFLHLSGRSPE